jgi:dethiobiotin synthetase
MGELFFVTGIGTDVGKTVASAIITQALGADYWKPVQAGYEQGTDAQTVSSLISDPNSKIHPEVYKLAMPASPHIAAAAEQVRIDTNRIKEALDPIRAATGDKPLIIEGAGGLLVPLNEEETIADLAALLDAQLIIVSRNYLGSINHSRLTAEYCRYRGLKVAGWVFSDQYMNYEEEIAAWTNYPILGSIPFLPEINQHIIREVANKIKPGFQHLIP